MTPKGIGPAPDCDIFTRAELYARAFPQWADSHFQKSVNHERIQATWFLGQDYRNKTRLYGAYPPNYLRRVLSMFPDVPTDRLLHLFSGSLDNTAGRIRFDINPENHPDVVGNAENLSVYFHSESFDLILADPPYSPEDAKRYGFPMPNIRKVLDECTKVITPGGYLVWLSTTWPMFSKRDWELAGTVAIVRSTNHRVRMSFIFRRQPIAPKAVG